MSCIGLGERTRKSAQAFFFILFYSICNITRQQECSALLCNTNFDWIRTNICPIKIRLLSFVKIHHFGPSCFAKLRVCINKETISPQNNNHTIIFSLETTALRLTSQKHNDGLMSLSITFCFLPFSVIFRCRFRKKALSLKLKYREILQVSTILTLRRYQCVYMAFRLYTEN